MVGGHAPRKLAVDWSSIRRAAINARLTRALLLPKLWPRHPEKEDREHLSCQGWRIVPFTGRERARRGQKRSLCSRVNDPLTAAPRHFIPERDGRAGRAFFTRKHLPLPATAPNSVRTSTEPHMHDANPRSEQAPEGANTNAANANAPLSQEQLMQAATARIAELEAELAEMKDRWMRAEAEQPPRLRPPPAGDARRAAIRGAEVRHRHR